MKSKSELALRAESAAARAGVYELLLAVFARLPEQALLERIRGDEFRSFLDTVFAFGDLKIKTAVNLLRSYLSGMENRSDADVLNELGVDRTRLLRGTDIKGLRPPYESLYCTANEPGMVLLSVRDAYRRAGLMPEENTGEPLDFICVELDFMYQLCLREYRQCTAGEVPADTISAEAAFRQRHLGRWVGLYSNEARKFAGTDFYRAFLDILAYFIEREAEYFAS